jgi:hypothetical protein
LNPEIVFEVFDERYWSFNFNVSVEDSDNKDHIHVDYDKVKAYVTPLAFIETKYKNGTVDILMANFKNCEVKIGRLCPDWETNNLKD